MILIGKENQSIQDIAFICYGSYDVVRLMKENPWITDINYQDFAGKQITYTVDKNNGTYALGLSSSIPSTSKTIQIDGLLQENGYFLLQENGFKILL